MACEHRRCEVLETADKCSVVACLHCMHQFRPDAPPVSDEGARYWARVDERLAIMRGER